MDSPIDKRDLEDVGDEVLRRFRYQFAYGVILLVGVATKKLDYKAIWCEQHEDFLAEAENEIFDAYQIKTKKSELGEWELNDEAFWKSLLRFVELDRTHPNKIRRFKFVSNTSHSNSSATDRIHLSPVRLLTAINGLRHWNALPAPPKKGFGLLKDKSGVTEKELFSILSRLDLINGPTDRAFEDELCQTHLPILDRCSNLCPRVLARIRDSLIAKIGEASSLFTNDPARHWASLNRDNHNDPLLLAKRITLDDLNLIIRDIIDCKFEYPSHLSTLRLGDATQQMDTLQEKMVRGGLSCHYEMMRRRALSAEQTLLDLATRSDDGERICSQLENVVLGECDDAYLRASQNSNLFGSRMLIDVQNRLQKLAQEEKDRVHRQPYDFLVGIAGLLSSECKVWWSARFQTKGQNES